MFCLGFGRSTNFALVMSSPLLSQISCTSVLHARQIRRAAVNELKTKASIAALPGWACHGQETVERLLKLQTILFAQLPPRILIAIAASALCDLYVQSLDFLGQARRSKGRRAVSRGRRLAVASVGKTTLMERVL